MTANPERGEVEIVLDGKPYPMRPSYEAAIAIEQELGSLIRLFRRVHESGDGLTIREMACIVHETIKAAGKDRGDAMLTGVNRARIAELLYAEGVVDVFQSAVARLLGNMLSGGSKKKAESPSSP